MLRDITLGRYYQVDSKIHKLDPRTKIFGLFAYLIMLFLCNNFISYILAIIFLGIIIYLSKVPLKFIAKGIKAILIILIITALFNLFLTPGDIVFKYYFISIAKQGIYKSLEISVRFIIIIFASNMLTLTTTPNVLTDGFEKSLGFLNKFKVPVHEIALMMSIALRFIPILMDETDRIIKAQTARGANFDTGSLFTRIKGMLTILVPLFVSAFKRAEDLALAMDARCYRGGESRTKLRPLKYGSCDIFGYTILILFISLITVINVLYILMW